ncbi:Rhodanese-like domain [Phytophthora cinnamomi]|uniref:Rhodanese-like domain n=1 Tax=Phytophthora cinnamomi TaxID=4785 RepID=UPI003559DF36|nr:Rhodanese-like domain [Phytophthora cinnamomi]
MPSRKTAPKRKRAAPAPSAPKKKQTVAAKQKHELAAAAEIIQWENEHELPSVIQRVDQCNDEKTHKRPLEATSPPALPGNNADSNKTTNCHGRDPVRPALSPPRNQHDPTAEFIEKHLLDGKLELPVLEFLDMMLA